MGVIQVAYPHRSWIKRYEPPCHKYIYEKYMHSLQNRRVEDLQHRVQKSLVSSSFPPANLAFSLFLPPVIRLHNPPLQRPRYQIRCFAQSSTLRKKGGKAARNEEGENKNDESLNPYDFSQLEANIGKAHKKLKAELSLLRAGGRFNHEAVENLRVNVDKGSKATERLGDLAQVVPKGRVLNILVGEKDVRDLIQAASLILVLTLDLVSM